MLRRARVTVVLALAGLLSSCAPAEPDGPDGPGGLDGAAGRPSTASEPAPRGEAAGAGGSPEGRTSEGEGDWRMDAKELVEELRRDGIRDERVLQAIERTPRHLMVPENVRDDAWANHPLPIGQGQTISQPYIVAWMTEAAGIERGENVLEVGTGSGYQAAVIAELLGLGPKSEVPAGERGSLATIEIVRELGERAKRTLEDIGYRDIAFRIGDGYAGWPERAPFDAIVVTAAPGHVPPALKEQLAVGGRLVIPVGEWMQELVVITRTEDGFDERRGLPVRFVPMTGEAQRRGGG